MPFAQITVLGRIGRDPETRTVGSFKVTDFSLAVDTGYGEKKICTWYRISAWGKNGETIASKCAKGDQLLVTGEPCERPYGEGKKSLEIELATFAFIGQPKSGNARNANDSHGKKASYNDDLPKSDGYEDEIPY